MGNSVSGYSQRVPEGCDWGHGLGGDGTRTGGARRRMIHTLEPDTEEVVPRGVLWPDVGNKLVRHRASRSSGDIDCCRLPDIRLCT